MRASSTRLAVLLMTATSALAFAGCGNTESCRPGTLFVTVELGPYAGTADRLEVEVALGAGGDAAASAPKQTPLTLKAGSRSGGVEIQFPDGYEAGRTATITLTLLSGDSPLAARVAMPVLPPGCGSLVVDFGASDAGIDGPAGAAGGGEGGAGGAATGGGGAATGGGGGAATGGTAGRAAGGRGGAAGGRGTGGSGGGAGSHGTAGAGGAGGAPCKPTGPENCFDNIDNDCNGKIDCADPACGATVAQCVAFDPTAAPIGLLSGGTGPCTTALFDQATAIFANQNQLSCTTIVAGQGCSCKPGAVTCSTTLAGFKTVAECAGNTSSGESAGKFLTDQDNACTASAPPWTTDAMGDIYGIAVTTFVATEEVCTPAGTPNVPKFAFGISASFCATKDVGGGCGAGQVCVPTTGSASPCQLFDGLKTTCPGGAAAAPWYTGSSGSATCGPCTCGSPSGAGCESMLLTAGSASSCSGAAQLQSNTRDCFGTGLSNPGVQFSGTPTPGNCSPMSTLGGNAVPTGPKTLCCPQ
jgi:hypothetical protein